MSRFEAIAACTGLSCTELDEVTENCKLNPTVGFHCNNSGKSARVIDLTMTKNLARSSYRTVDYFTTSTSCKLSWPTDATKLDRDVMHITAISIECASF